MEKQPIELSTGDPDQRWLSVRSCAMRCAQRLARCLLLPLILAVPLLNGCHTPKNLGISTAQTLAVPLPQDFEVAAAADSVFAIITREAEGVKNCHVIARSPKDRLISWCERIEKWQDLGLDTVGYKSQDILDPDFYKKMAEDNGKGVAIITVWVEDLGPKSRVHIRRITYGDQSFAGMGHSRGEFEYQLHQTIVSQL